jgi:hypothetical protein
VHKSNTGRLVSQRVNAESLRAREAVGTNREIMSWLMLKRIGTSEFKNQPEKT